MKIKELTREHITAIMVLEKDHAPDRPHYARYDKEALNFIFDNPKICHAYGIFGGDDLICWGAYRSGWSKDNLEEGVYEISSIVVHTDYRRKGLGKMMLDKILKEIRRNQKYKKIYLTVSPLNLGALLLYLKNGFMIYDFKKNVYGEGADRIYLVKE